MYSEGVKGEERSKQQRRIKASFHRPLLCGDAAVFLSLASSIAKFPG